MRASNSKVATGGLLSVKRRLRHRRRQVYEEKGEGGLELTAIGDVRITGRLGEGVTCVVYLAEWKGREVALRLYKAGAVERHARYHHQELAEFEYSRNLEFYQAPGLSRYVAQPLAYLSVGGLSAMVQEKLNGVLYYHYYQSRKGEVPDALREHVRRIVELAHEAGLYDVDLHAGNILVVEDNGEPIPKLFDFNFIPFYIHAPNPFVYLMVKTGLISLRWRDLRKLRNFHNFKRWERKLAKYYDGAKAER